MATSTNFQKRCYRKKVSPEFDSELEECPGEGGHDENKATEDEPASILQRAIELRRLRKPISGIDIGDLITPKDSPGDLEKRQRKDTIISIENFKDGRFSTSEAAFATETNALDNDCAMKEYIENELRIRRGKYPESKDESSGRVPSSSLDYNLISEILKNTIKTAKNDVNVNIPSSMLTGVPEVNLGIETKLKNIEKTEIAKKEFWKRKSKDSSEASSKSSLDVTLVDSGLDKIRFWTKNNYNSSLKKAKHKDLNSSLENCEGDMDNKCGKRKLSMRSDIIALGRFKKKFKNKSK